MIVVIGDVINDILTKAHDVLTPNSDNRATITIVPGGSASNTAAWLGAVSSAAAAFACGRYCAAHQGFPRHWGDAVFGGGPGTAYRFNSGGG